MLEGLEIKEILLSEPLHTELLRLESEFYTAKTFTINKSYSGLDIIDFVQYGTSDELNEEKEGYPVLRLNEFQSNFIGTPAKCCKLLDKSTYESLKLRKNDVLICRTNGNPKLVGKSAIVQKDYEFAYASYLFKIRPKKELINASALVTFLNSKYGRLEIEKFSMVSNQVNFSPAKFREMRIPNFNAEFNDKIEHLTFESYNLLDKSQILYLQAETLLLETLGLNSFEPTAEAVNVKSFKESFLSSGRLDAEYYQKKYEDYIELVCSYPNGYESIEVACKQKDVNYTPKDNSEYKYIELANIGETGDITGCTIALGSELPTRARRKVNTNDVIISSIEGSLDSCAIITEEYDNALCSTGFYIISSTKINSETLLVLFKSEPIQNILKKGCSGTILTAINKTEFQNIPIPTINKLAQDKIASLISESFMLKKQSEQLLGIAKRAVEIAIEESEETAMHYIQQNN